MDKFINIINEDFTVKPIIKKKQIEIIKPKKKIKSVLPPFETKIPLIPKPILKIIQNNIEPQNINVPLNLPIPPPIIYNTIPQTAFNSRSNYFSIFNDPYNLNVINNLTVGNTTTTVNLVADNANITNDLNVSGNIIGNGTLNITGNITGQNLDITSNITTANLSVSSGEIFLIDDTAFNNKLHAINQNLYFNNELLAKANDIQNVSDWSLYPALQDVDMDLNGFFNTKEIKFNSSTTNILTTDTSNNLTYNGDIILTTASPTTGVASLNTLSGNVNITSTNIATLTVAQVGQDIQLTVPPVVAPTPSTWSNYPAISDVQMSGYKLIDPNQTGITVDAGVNIAQIPTVLLNSKNGLGGLIDLVADNGYLGTSYGRINLTSNGGDNAGISTGGTINITSNCPAGVSGVIGGQINIIANTPVGLTPTATAKILTSASGILSWAGATSPLASQAGFNYVHGDLQVNLTAGLPPFFANDPLCVYIYGNNGTLMYGTQYMGKIRPYSDLLTNPVDLRIESYNNGFSTGYIVIDGAKSITMASTASINNVSTLNMTSGDITGVSTINGSAYPPPPTVYQATYYKSVQQNLVNPNTDITFDVLGSWSNEGGYITHTSGSKDFTVVQTGLYSLQFNLSVNANGATWNTGVNKTVSIDITRSPIAEQAIIQNSQAVANSTSYQQSISTSYYLVAGDIINFRSTLAYATATPFAIGILNTFDLNTFVSWQYITA